jgi:hypothetical protein
MTVPQSGQLPKSGQEIWLADAVSAQLGHSRNLARLALSEPEIHP